MNNTLFSTYQNSRSCSNWIANEGIRISPSANVPFCWMKDGTQARWVTGLSDITTGTGGCKVTYEVGCSNRVTTNTNTNTNTNQNTNTQTNTQTSTSQNTQTSNQNTQTQSTNQNTNTNQQTPTSNNVQSIGEIFGNLGSVVTNLIYIIGIIHIIFQ